MPARLRCAQKRWTTTSFLQCKIPVRAFPPEDLVRIFEDFQQVDNSITRQKGGHWTGAVDRSSSHRNAWRPHRPGHDSGRGFDIHHLLADTRDRSEAGGMTKRILVVED